MGAPMRTKPSSCECGPRVFLLREMGASGEGQRNPANHLCFKQKDSRCAMRLEVVHMDTLCIRKLAKSIRREFLLAVLLQKVAILLDLLLVIALSCRPVLTCCNYVQTIRVKGARPLCQSVCK